MTAEPRSRRRSHPSPQALPSRLLPPAPSPGPTRRARPRAATLAGAVASGRRAVGGSPPARSGQVAAGSPGGGGGGGGRRRSAHPSRRAASLPSRCSAGTLFGQVAEGSPAQGAEASDRAESDRSASPQSSRGFGPPRAATGRHGPTGPASLGSPPVRDSDGAARPPRAVTCHHGRSRRFPGTD